MKKVWINKQGNKKCILFFNGWGADCNAILNIDCQGLDVCVFFDYSSFEIDSSDFAEYSQLYLVAWSLGVYAAVQSISKTSLSFVKKIAINGTETPVHNELGIPIKTFLGTLRNWNSDSKDKFNSRMFSSKKNMEENRKTLSGRDVENQRLELEFLFLQTKEAEQFKINWDVAFVGASDLIFLTNNQHSYWVGKCRLVEKESPHFPFLNFSKWQEIIDL